MGLFCPEKIIQQPQKIFGILNFPRTTTEKDFSYGFNIYITSGRRI